MASKKEEKIGEALLKVALGYQIAEVTEEYAEVDGALKLTKRKKTKKDIPPDLKAVQMLLECGGAKEEYSGWSDEDLEREKTRLLGMLESDVLAQTVENVSKLSGIDGEITTAKAVVKKSAQKRSVMKKSAVKKTVGTKKTTK